MRGRLPAAERRADVLDCACRVFAEGSYRGTTTAEIAREAGVTEPILYRHFDSKRALYLACLEETWSELKGVWERTLEAEDDPSNVLRAIGRAFFELERERPVVSSLWIQAIAEASDDEEIRGYMRDHLREVHAFVTEVIVRSQAEGGILPGRDARAEAWLFLSMGFLKMISRRLGGVVDDDFPAMVASRREWLTGLVDG